MVGLTVVRRGRMYAGLGALTLAALALRLYQLGYSDLTFDESASIFIARMPLAETTALIFVTPLLVALLAVPLLKEHVGAARWAAILVGFLGVLLVARPGGALAGAGVGFALVAALCYSLYQIFTRQLAGHENPVAMLFYTALIGTVVMTLGLPWFWGGPMLDAL